jgi:DNA-binding ferritin-like protein (Dps family)
VSNEEGSFGEYADLFERAAAAARKLAVTDESVETLGADVSRFRDRLTEMATEREFRGSDELRAAEVHVLVTTLLELGRAQGRKEALA